MGIKNITVKCRGRKILGNDLDNLGAKARERLEYLEWRLFWEGSFNRSDLMKQFDVSKPQVSVDLRKYKEIAESNLTYNAKTKRFAPTLKMKPKLLTVSATRLLLQLRALSEGVISRTDVWFKHLPEFDVLPDLRTEVKVPVLRRVLRAIRLKRSILILYGSLNSTSERKIAPHALAFDGQRWHARAWCFKHEEFRDFVLTRIKKTKKTHACDINPSNDTEWTKTVELVLQAHPDLSAQQRKAVENDYDMKSGERRLAVRHALAFYLIQNLDLDVDGLPPKRCQVRLKNRSEVFDTIDWQTTLVDIRL